MPKIITPLPSQAPIQNPTGIVLLFSDQWRKAKDTNQNPKSRIQNPESKIQNLMIVRPAKDSDVAELAHLYRQTVEVNAPQYYTPAQTQAWSAFASNLEAFRAFITGVTTYVAVDETQVLGFAGIGNDGHVLSVYVRYDSLGGGIGSALMQHLLQHAQTHSIQRLYAEASEFSLGLFQKFGFRLYETEQVERGGVKFHRYLVERLLDYSP